MRYAILRVSPFMFIEICKHGVDGIKVIKDAVPEDAQFQRAFVEDSSGWGDISLVLESKSFPDVKHGSTIPILSEPMFEKKE